MSRHQMALNVWNNSSHMFECYIIYCEAIEDTGDILEAFSPWKEQLVQLWYLIQSEGMTAPLYIIEKKQARQQ